jgi:outer membrane receptor protein involved in Fe transport
MKPNLPCPLLAFAVAACACLSAGAQPAPNPTTPASSPSAPVPAESSPDQIVKLTPFDVRADRDNSYGAENSNAITRFNVELSKLPVSADIFTQAFMDDIAAVSVETMVAGNSAGAGMAAIDAASATAQQGDHVAHNYVQLRGFDTSAMQRDSLMPVGPLFNPGSTGAGQTSVFDVERVEVIDGPQALLYSGGGPGGVINVVSKQAYFGQAPSGTLVYRTDQYGTQYGQFDANVGNDKVAVRLALLDQDSRTRRVNVGQKVKGEYLQFAAKLFRDTTLRLDLEQTVEHAFNGNPGVSLSAQVSGDARAGLALSYLLASNQAGANTVNPSTGLPNTAGAILGGMLNWNNLDSWSGWLAAEYTKTTFETATFDTEWGRGISTELAFGYSSANYAFRSGAATLYAPTNSTNPTGTWAFALSPSETDEPAVNKAIRFSILDTADLFDGKAHSQTILGADFVGSRAHSIAYSYWLADSNFNPVYSSAISTNNGRTKMPNVYFPIGAGFQRYPLMPLGAGTFTYNGSNYVRMTSNQVNPTLINPANPLGLSGTGLNEFNIVDNKGIFLTNLTQWGRDRKLTTLLGVRADDNFDSLVYTVPVYRVAAIRSLDYDIGANYALLSWLSPYFSVSNTVTPPQVMFPDPAGNLPQPGRGVGEEVGVKFRNKANSISGSVAVYHSTGTNEEFDLSSSVVSVINPSGLNGSYSGSSGYTDLNRRSKGLQAVLTASPTRNWRIRLSAAYQDGRISNNASYSPLYNDQFHVNSAGQVTYQDGVVVYVNSNAFSSKTPVVSPTSAGAVPLTLAMMNNPSSLYYANPTNPNGAISGSSAVATVLKSTSSTDGAILTGATGLPISMIQISTPFGLPTPVTIFQSGQRTLGTPLYSMNFSTLYAFDEGWAKGISIGGTVNAAYDTVHFYYNPSPTIATANPQLVPFYAPVSVTVNPVFAYQHRFKDFTLKLQLNINNLFNHYEVVITPSQVTGYSVPANLNAAFYGQPRLYTFTTTIKF